ncbi:MAG: rhodanese-like domain-containing protein [Acidobacteria bacterium]|nr:rhodanese-like domain-containing protein [Acidobacteriota bacterium]
MTRRVFIPAVLALAAAALLGACKATDRAGNTSAAAPKAGANPAVNAPAGTTEVHADGVRRVTVAELQKMLEDGSAVLYDTRAKTAYDAEHIRSAGSIPYDEVLNRAGELPKDKTLVFYCT